MFSYFGPCVYLNAVHLFREMYYRQYSTALTLLDATEGAQGLSHARAAFFQWYNIFAAARRPAPTTNASPTSRAPPLPRVKSLLLHNITNCMTLSDIESPEFDFNCGELGTVWDALHVLTGRDNACDWLITPPHEANTYCWNRSD